MKEGSEEGNFEGVAERQGDEVKFFFGLKMIKKVKTLQSVFLLKTLYSGPF
jgi:hypothetical protein